MKPVAPPLDAMPDAGGGLPPAAERYMALMAGGRETSSPDEAFDLHVFACAVASAGDGEVAASLGLPAAACADLLGAWFPDADLAPGAGAHEPELEESLVADLLALHGADRSAETRWIGAIIARRSMHDDHLWQDLGLFDRAELGRLMRRRFPALAAANTTGMRWKKFLYRKLCEAEGFALCSAPSCKECAEFDACFGAEDGESRLARMKREAV